MKKINYCRLVLILILVLAAGLRFWQLGQVPPSPDWDEAALGYNAYSILETGRDEYGKQFPLILRSFDDYKPALYVYLVVPFVKLLGLSVLAVRLPAAILGTLAVLMTYLLVKEIFGKKAKSGELIALVSAFLLAISPWHLQFSRVAFETNVGMFFNVVWVLFFLKGLKRPRFLAISALFAGLNIYLYQAEKVFTPLLVLAMALIYRKKLFSLNKKWLVSAIALGLVLVAPFGYLAMTTPEVFLRAKGTSFASDLTPFLSKTVTRLDRNQQAGDWLGQILDNRRITYALAFVDGYLSHFNFNWLFISGDEARHHAPGMGLLLLAELPFLLWGFYSLIFSRFSRQLKLTIFAWLLLAPIPAAFSSGAPHAVRTLRMMPMIQVITGLGVIGFWGFLKDKANWLRYGLISIVSLLFIFNFGYFLNQYFTQLNYFTSQDWQFGYQQAVAEVEKISGDYQKIIVSNQPHMDQSYMFFLFYLKYDPRAYQTQGGTFSGGFAESRNNFDKYEFRPINWSTETGGENLLYVGRPVDFPGGVSNVVETINFVDGQPAILIVRGS